jgi:hypothetical protein
MSNPTRTIRRDIRVFISAVKRELGSVRKLVKKRLEDNDYHAVEQDNFPPDYREQKKPAGWFLPLEEPIAPHLNQLLVPAEPVKQVLESLDRRVHPQKVLSGGSG